MKLPLSWLREFVDVTAEPDELGHRLSMCGFELASIEQIQDEVVLDFEVTANRPDCLSVIGLAREVSAAYSLPMRQPGPTRTPLPVSGDAGIRVTLEAPDLCPRYAAAVFDVTIGPSPAWLAGRLKAAGVRPINNVVDVTNYVLLEMGQPMHAFDIEKLAGRELRIRRGREGESITTLDGVERVIDPNLSNSSLVIADAARAQAVAGIMGGASSEVSSSTKIIVLESAHFKPNGVRSVSLALGLKTEASIRFERGTDIGAPVAAIERAAALLEQIGAGRPHGPVIDDYPQPSTPVTIALRSDRIDGVLGQAIPAIDVERILTALDFGVHGQQPWQVTVPSFRVDVSRDIDLIEEIGRHYGYDKLPTTFPALGALPPPSDPRIERDRLVRRVLQAAGCSEALTFSFIDLPAKAQFAGDGGIHLANPLSGQFSILRDSTLPGLLASVAHNVHRQRQDVRLFEIGATFSHGKGESRRVGMILTGAGGGEHWSGGRSAVDFFDAKGLVEQLCSTLGVEPVFDATGAPSYLVRGRAARVSASGEQVGAVGMLTPAALIAFGLHGTEEIFAAELNLDILADMRPAALTAVTPPPRYPSIARDISIIVDDTLPAAAVRGTIRSAAPDTLQSVREFDRYQGKGVPDGRVSLSLRLTFRSPERTLTDAEVQKAMEAIVAILVKEHQAVQR